MGAAPPEVCVGKNGGLGLLGPPSVAETVPDGDKEAEADEDPDEEEAMVVEEEEGTEGGDPGHSPTEAPGFLGATKQNTEPTPVFSPATAVCPSACPARCFRQALL